MVSKIHPKVRFFQDAFLEIHFDDFILILCENDRFWDPVKFQWAPKWQPKSIAIGVPAGLLNYFQALYHTNACYANFGNGTESPT